MEMLIVAVAVAIFTAIAMTFDLKTRKIPNWLTMPTLAIAVVFHAATAGLEGLGTTLGGFAVGFGLLLVLWLIGGGGGGDVKLMGALGAWLGAPLTLIVFFLSSMIALIIAVTVRVRSMVLKSSFTRDDDLVDRAEEIEASNWIVPYAVPVALATWLVVCAKLVSESGAP